jgi:hypothetical protein
MATAEEYEKMRHIGKEKEDWMNAKWRPMMGLDLHADLCH